MSDDDPETSDLLWSMIFLVLGATIIIVWNTAVPAGLLWLGYLSLAITVVFLVKWFRSIW